jgi:hypothetical protein
VTGRPSGYLLRRIPGAVASAPGRGCSRADLAAALHVREHEEVFALSVLVCYRRGDVDFCAGYVVAPARGSRSTEGESP